MRVMPIDGYEGFYTVSESGLITSLARLTSDGRNIKERVLKPRTVRGYAHVTLCNENGCKQLSVHRIVASHFLGSGAEGEVVNHIDGDKLNNTVSNLEWCTHSDNNIHALTHGLRVPKSGQNHHRFSAPVIATRLSSGEEYTLCGEKEIRGMGFDYATVRNCVAGKRKRHKGFTFRSG
ncbi:NUMOD4 motif-containing HNH endonuclease [Enterobacter rongchengensis]|uniref:NUMOD4 motif-containing HNH endonuclease n=1 Tax=Enterobacter rongchengensis TaxID=3030999 RepID=UPI0025C9721C|nr:HNH endonuclease [Citrobacter freundii]ELP5232468.1 HNH endonuclease [Citrobacter freundii]HDW1379473.1 HNH endonuclease [Enterobacter asburiae]HEO9244980.1 HNH endonuclease [Enterobacter kobei]